MTTIDRIKDLLKTNRIDVVILVLTLFLSLMLIERPKDIENLNVKTNTQEVKEQTDIDKENNSNDEQDEDEDEYKFIKERNIFAQNGKYVTVSPKILQQLPENPYNLIAIFKGTEKRALFRDYKGNMHFVKEGDQMIDDATIEEITTTSVKVKKEDEIKEFKVFSVTPKKDEKKKNP